jgi:hypothetical protein
MKTGNDLKGAVLNFIHGQRMIAWSQEWESFRASGRFSLFSSQTKEFADNPFEAALCLAEQKCREKLVTQRLGMAQGHL